MRIPPLLKKAAVQLLHLLHARLAPFRFLLNLSLLSLLLRLASSPALHAFLLRTSTSFLQAFRRLHLLHHVSLLLKAFTLHLVLLLLTHFIILALLFTSRCRGVYITTSSSSQAAAFTACPAFMSHFDQEEDDDDDNDEGAHKLPSDDTSANYVPPNEVCIAASAPPIELSISDAGTSAYPPRNEPTSNISTPSVDILATSSLCRSTINNQPELVPITEENLGQQTTRNQLGKQSIASCTPLDTDDILRLSRYNSHYEKPACAKYTLASASSSKSSLHDIDVEIVPIIGTVSHAEEDAHQKSLFRHKSDTQVSQHVANRYRYYGRTVSCAYYYEYAKEAGCSTARLYTASRMDSLSKEDAQKHFSKFAAHNWARMRKDT